MVKLDSLWVVFLVALTPSIGLLLRGVVWGADSFAFWAVASGIKINSSLSSPVWFIELIKLLNSNFVLLVGIMFIFYFFGLLGIREIGKKVFLNNFDANKLVLFVGSLTPLFFIEALRFENQFFSVCLAFMAVGLAITSNKDHLKLLYLIIAVILALLSLNLWFASILILYMALLFKLENVRLQTAIVLTGLVIGSIFFVEYLLFSFTQLINSPMNLIGEEIPLVGLFFIIHIVTFIKFVPKKYLPYTILLLGIGLVKVKYVFLVTPLLLIGLIKKDKLKGIYFRKDKIELVPIAFICLIGLTIMSPFLYPTQIDLLEIKTSIVIANQNGLELRNDWGDGWVFEYLGHNTPYKISNGNEPLWDKNHYIAYTKQDLNWCQKINTKTYIC